MKPIFIGLQKIIPKKFMNMTLVLTKATLFIFVYLCLLGVPLLIGRSLFGDQHLWYLPLVIMGIMAGIAPFAYEILSRRAESTLLLNHRNYQKILQELTKDLALVKDVEEVLPKLVEKIRQSLDPLFSGVYVFDLAAQKYQLKYAYFKANPILANDISSAALFVQELNRDKKTLILNQENAKGHFPSGTLVVPCFIKQNLYAFAVIGAKSGGYSEQDLEIFTMISAQVSLTVEKNVLEAEKLVMAKYEQIRRQQTMDRYSASLAHEIENPVYAVTGLVDVIKMKIDEDLADCIPSQDQQYLQNRLERISLDLARISRMIRTIRDFSSQTSGFAQPVDIDEIIADFENLACAQFKYEKIQYLGEVEPKITVYADKIHLVEILINFATNAMHAVKQNSGEKKVELKVYRINQDLFRIEFSDNGYGVTLEMQEDIFLDFVTTKASTEGLGLGLSQVRKIVQRYKGKVWVESQGQGKGAKFIVELPIYKA